MANTLNMSLIICLLAFPELRRVMGEANCQRFESLVEDGEPQDSDMMKEALKRCFSATLYMDASVVEEQLRSFSRKLSRGGKCLTVLGSKDRRTAGSQCGPLSESQDAIPGFGCELRTRVGEGLRASTENDTTWFFHKNTSTIHCALTQWTAYRVPYGRREFPYVS